jgi:hypothetical protein
MRPFLITFLGCLLAVASFVYWADPAGRWHPAARFPAIVLAGHDTLVWPSGRIDERRARETQLRVGAAADLVLMGSSRVFLVDQAMFPSEFRVVNTGVSGGTIEDFIGFWQELKENRRVPRYLIIFADPWIFGGAYDNASWYSLANYTSRFLRRDGAWPVWRLTTWAQQSWTNFGEVLSWSALIKSLDVAKSRLHKADQERFIVVRDSELDPTRYAFRADGSVVYPADILTPRTAEEMRKAGDAFVDQQPSYSLADWKTSGAPLRMFEKLTQDAAALHVHVLIVFSPYQHETLQKIMGYDNRARVLRSLVTEVRQIAAKTDATFCDALNPADSACDATEFMDGMHMLRSCAAKVVSHCLSLDDRWAKLRTGDVQDTVLPK